MHATEKNGLVADYRLMVDKVTAVPKVQFGTRPLPGRNLRCDRATQFEGSAWRDQQSWVVKPGRRLWGWGYGMDAKFAALVEILHPAYLTLMEKEPVTAGAIPAYGGATKGVYLFAKAGERLYAGRSNHLFTRYQNN